MCEGCVKVCENELRRYSYKSRILSPISTCCGEYVVGDVLYSLPYFTLRGVTVGFTGKDKMEVFTQVISIGSTFFMIDPC